MPHWIDIHDGLVVYFRPIVLDHTLPTVDMSGVDELNILVAHWIDIHNISESTMDYANDLCNADQ